jgi:hypothetical protein
MVTKLVEANDWWQIEKELLDQFCWYDDPQGGKLMDAEAYKLVVNLRKWVSKISKLGVGAKKTSTYKAEVENLNQYIEELEQNLFLRVLQR